MGHKFVCENWTKKKEREKYHSIDDFIFRFVFFDDTFFFFDIF